MTGHLLLVTIGPVQDFIAQARRTRDLWYGSHLLSELGRAAARALVDGGASLIFPAIQAGDPDLASCLAPLLPDGTPPQNIANKLLAEVPAEVDPRELARQVRKSVADHWREDLALSVKEKCAGLLAPDIDAVWNEQIDTLPEFAASWLPLGDYAETRRELEQAIARRKLLRDFEPWTQGRGQVPKSSLDGARESVLLPPRHRQAGLARKYRIADGEELDAVGLVKRAGGEPDQFVPVVNVALASWLQRARQVAPESLDRLEKACREVGVSRVARPDLPCVAPFAFDASVLLASRWRSLFEEQGLAGDPESWGRQHVRPLMEAVEEPYPYVACLVADGDRMGRAIGALGSARGHRELSAALARFTASARKVVEQDHRGVLVYAGGDDVLAFLPLPEALACAESLRQAFVQGMETVCESLSSEFRPTLSVGLGIGHVMESLGDLLELGRRAEREAKQDRNALAVVVDKRSGGTWPWRRSWTDDPVKTLHAAVGLLQDRLSSRKVYEVASLLRRMPRPEEAQGEDWARVLEGEVKRSLSRVEGDGLSPADAGLRLDPELGYPRLFDEVQEWVARLLLARMFQQSEVRERGSRKGAS